MSTSGLLWLSGFTLVVVWFSGRAIWHAWATSRVRTLAAAVAPTVDELERAVTRFQERFPPRPTGMRLPIDADGYPEVRPRTPSPPRRQTRRSSSYRRRH